jgi:transposase InsO family protein
VNADEGRQWRIPPMRTMHTLVNKRIPLAVQVLHREGMAAYEAKCAPYIQVDPDSVEPGQWWIGDHHQLNCWVRHRDRWIRPWITAWMDMRSRELVGWYISACPNQTTVLVAMRRAIEKHGPPESVKIDNGKDYDSQMWTGTTKTRRRAAKAGYIDAATVAGIYAMLDIAVSFAIPYHPQSKLIERFFDTVDVQFTKAVDTYCGKDANRKPEHLSDMLKSEHTIAEAYSLAEFAEVFGEYAKVYSNSVHTGWGMKGKSPGQVMASRSSRRVLKEGVLDLLMRVWSGELKIGKNGVRFRGLYYGQYDSDLLVRQGRKVRVSYNPDDLSVVYVYDAVTWKLIAVAEQNQLVAYGDAVPEGEVREAMAQKSRALKLCKGQVNKQLTANMDLASLAIRARRKDAEPDPAPARVASIRPVGTPLDGQVDEHARQRAVKVVRKAAGAEATRTVLDIDLTALRPGSGRRDTNLGIDLSMLTGSREPADLELFDER